MTEVRVTVTEPSDLRLWPRQQVSRSPEYELGGRDLEPEWLSSGTPGPLLG